MIQHTPILPVPPSQENDSTLVEVKGLKVYFPIKGGLLGQTVGHVKAVDGVDLFIKRGETLGTGGREWLR